MDRQMFEVALKRRCSLYYFHGMEFCFRVAILLISDVMEYFHKSQLSVFGKYHEADSIVNCKIVNSSSLIK